MIKECINIVGLSLSLLPLCARGQSRFPHQDPGLPVEKRVDDLVSRMTLEEKTGQMQNNAPAIARLGVPAYNWWNEALHGVARNGVATVFPQAIGMAATWDPALVKEEADVISTEARAKHHEALRQNQRGIYQGLTFWSPNINIFRDPRWGRGQETYGEDPYLTSRIGVAFVRGLQGDDPEYFKVIATPKHFAVHSGPESLRHRFDARTRTRDLYETYLPAFESCITEGGAYSIMGAYNRYDGEACCASQLLLGDLLRGTWKFPGYVLSDCGAIMDIYAGHRIVKNAAEASALAVKAGCDLTCGGEYEALGEAVVKGLITENEITLSVRRLMRARFRLGMFDPPDAVRYAGIPMSENDTDEHSMLARKVACESIVLLKNAKKALPLSTTLNTIAVIGPTADDLDVLVGNYNGTPSHPVTILQGIRNRVAPGTKVLFARGCDIAEGIPPGLDPIAPKFLKTHVKGVAQQGLTGEYFANMELKGTPALVRTDSVVDFEWSVGSPAEEIPGKKFSVRWTGKLLPEVSGTYMLGVVVDDGFRLFVDNALFQEEWTEGPVRTRAKEIALEAGREYDIRLDYYQNQGDAAFRFGWALKGPGPVAEALAAAREADQIIAVMGISPQLEGEEMGISLKGFSGGDRTDLSLPAPQEDLLRQLAGLGKPIVLVLTSGGALSIPWAQENIAAILEAWYPGQQGGNAVADVLFGYYNPAGRLPVTFYRSVADLPPFEDYSMEGRTYRFFRGTPLYPFGHGLSYTRFEYGNAEVVQSVVGVRDTIKVKIPVTNTGDADGDEVVQVYVRNSRALEQDPIRSLKGFARTHLKKGETKRVEIQVAVNDLRVYDEKTKSYGVVPGSFELQIGASSSDIRTTTSVRVAP